MNAGADAEAGKMEITVASVEETEAAVARKLRRTPLSR
jgi:hypothetical protein